MTSTRAATGLAGLWAGVLLCVGTLSAPSAFATLLAEDAGRFVGRLFAQEAYFSLAMASVLFLIERNRSSRTILANSASESSLNLVLVLCTLFCTIVGYFAVQPMMVAAHAGQGVWSFGALHAVSGSLFVLKGLLVFALAWRLTAR